MRLIQRRALIVAVAVALVSSLAVLPSVAAAAKSKGPTIQKLNKRVTAISRTLNVVANNLKNVTGTVNQGIPIITQLVSGLQKASAGLTALQNGLTSLSAAVQNTSTGLPGLNAARSLVGFVVSNAAATGSEFSVTHAAGGGGTGAYLLSFVNGATPPVATDVSKRVIEVTSANPLQVGVTFSAANCSVAAVTPTCTALAGATDAKPTDVLVVSSLDNRDFQVAAISG
jgi:X-X-X-Leu-X-X-Gly heptad repeat protein